MDLLDPLVPEQQPVASGQPLPELVRVLHLETMEALKAWSPKLNFERALIWKLILPSTIYVFYIQIA